MTDKEMEYIGICYRLLNDYNLSDWKCQINNRSRNTNGRCYYGRHLIELSSFLIKNGTHEEIMDIIIHEIAHALTPYHMHDRVWKEQYLRMGGTGEVYSRQFAPHKYTAKCTTCERSYGRNKMPKGNVACSNCCQRYNNGKYDIFFKITFQRSVE